MSEKEIRNFVSNYLKAANYRDLDALIEFYSLPVRLQSGKSIQLVEKKDELTNCLEDMLGLHETLDIAKIEADGIEILQQKKETAIFDLDWHLQNAMGFRIFEFKTTFVLSKVDQKFKIVFLLNHPQPLNEVKVQPESLLEY